MLALDTNTISYYFRGDPLVTTRISALAPSDLVVPTVVIYELRYGLARLPEAARESRLRALDAFLRLMTSLPFDDESAAIAAQLRAALETQGSPIGPHDVLIAATALAHRATLVTRNVREFSRVPGLRVENWHAGEPSGEMPGRPAPKRARPKH